MVNSPASTSRRSPTSRSTSNRQSINYPTQRSAVSTAFDDKKVFRDSNPSIVSAGTVVNPSATAAELISAAPTYKSPAIITQSSSTQPVGASSPPSTSQPSSSAIASNSATASSQPTLAQKTTNFQPTSPPPVSILKPSSPSPKQVKISTPSDFSTASTGPSSAAAVTKVRPHKSMFMSMVEPVM